MKSLEAFINAVMAAVSNCRLYGVDHPYVDDNTRRALQVLDEVLSGRDTLEIMVIDDDLVVNRQPMKKRGPQTENFLKRLKERGISRVEIYRDLDTDELRRFVEYMAGKGRGLEGVKHIRVGVVSVACRGPSEVAEESQTELMEYPEEIKGIFKSMYGRGGLFSEINIRSLEEMVLDFFITLKREVSLLRLLAPVVSYDEYTYTHAVNVAVLSMFQAESLGLSGKMLQDVGVSGLLHDVGKVFIEKEVIQKKGALGDREINQIKLHPLLGAKYLSTIKGITPLAPVVAYEHHIRYDGKGYPSQRAGYRQHPCSQIVAVADYFDALRTVRPYRGAVSVRDTLSIMQKEAGRGLNPFLLDNFIKVILPAMQ